MGCYTQRNRSIKNATLQREIRSGNQSIGPGRRAGVVVIWGWRVVVDVSESSRRGRSIGISTIVVVVIVVGGIMIIVRSSIVSGMRRDAKESPKIEKETAKLVKRETEDQIHHLLPIYALMLSNTGHILGCFSRCFGSRN